MAETWVVAAPWELHIADCNCCPLHYLQIISVQLLLFGPPLLLVGEDLPVGLLLGQATLLGQVAALALPRPLLLTIADLSRRYSSSFTAGLRDRHKR